MLKLKQAEKNVQIKVVRHIAAQKGLQRTSTPVLKIRKTANVHTIPTVILKKHVKSYR